jgi:hypothetical protein
MRKTYFESNTVITEQISNADLKAYFVGYDFGQFRYDSLINKIMSVVVDFAFGFHEGILTSYKIEELRNAARMVYKVEEYDPSNPNHLKSTKVNGKQTRVPYKDAEEFKDKRYYNRGEFGELILHLLLRDFLDTTPLLSKIYLRDSFGVTVKGLDAIHIGNDISDPTLDSIFFGESKLHRTGETGVEELVKDVKEHFNSNFLNGEFLLVGNKKNNFLPLDEYADKNTYTEYCNYITKKNYWYNELKSVQKGDVKLQDLFSSVTVPMLCTYTSKVLSKHTDEQTDEFQIEFENEVKGLQKLFKEKLDVLKQESKGKNPIITDLNIVLMLFPVPDKKELVKRLHDKLHHQQRI